MEIDIQPVSWRQVELCIDALTQARADTLVLGVDALPVSLDLGFDEMRRPVGGDPVKDSHALGQAAARVIEAMDHHLGAPLTITQDGSFESGDARLIP